MKTRFLSILALTFLAFPLLSQEMILPNKPYSTLSPSPGYITINEFGAGFGLGETDVDYGKYLYGFTTIHGYQINKNFMFAGGTGLLMYNGGALIPLFMDFRYSFYISTLTPYIFGDGGFLLNPSDINSGTKLFVNAGPGVRFTMSRKLGFNFGAGLLIQMGQAHRDAFINFKLGVTFKPN